MSARWEKGGDPFPMVICMNSAPRTHFHMVTFRTVNQQSKLLETMTLGRANRRGSVYPQTMQRLNWISIAQQAKLSIRQEIRIDRLPDEEHCPAGLLAPRCLPLSSQSPVPSLWQVPVEPSIEPRPRVSIISAARKHLRGDAPGGGAFSVNATAQSSPSSVMA
jgi:hypothetical protein